MLLLLSHNVNSKEINPSRPLDGFTTSSNDGVKKNNIIVLQSIIRSNKTRKAVIDGKILYVGDIYKGFELLNISSKGVVLRSSQGERELSLFSSVIVNSK